MKRRRRQKETAAITEIMMAGKVRIDRRNYRRHLSKSSGPEQGSLNMATVNFIDHLLC